MNTECRNTFEGNYTILSSDVDSNYMVTSVSLMRDLQDCVINILTRKHTAPYDLEKEGMYWVITEEDMHFIDDRPVWGDEITFQIVAIAKTPMRIYLDYKAKIRNGRYFAEGYTAWSILGQESHRPVNLDRMVELEGLESGEYRKNDFSRRLPSGTPVRRLTHRMKMTDLDISGHVGTMGYLRFAVNTMTKEDLRDYEPERICMRYNRETFEDEILTCEMYRDEDSRGVPVSDVLIMNQDGETVCRIYCRWRAVYGQDYSDFIQEFRREYHHVR